MEALRTPDSFFENLDNYPFAPNYVELKNGLRMHYVDEGQGPLVLLLHGEPSWSYLYRFMITSLAAKGYRVVAPDLIGFGKSDKPRDPATYTYQTHRDWLHEFLVVKKLEKINLFCQDWGGLLGLRIVGELPQLFDRVAASNTFLPTGDLAPGEAFLKWREFSQNISKLPIAKIIQGATVRKLSVEEVRAYTAPFPDESYKTGARKFPMLVPISPDDPSAPANRLAWEGLKNFQKPFLTLFGDSDPVTRGADLLFRRYVPGAKKQPHKIIAAGGHFIQEDKPDELCEHMHAWIQAS
jgi:haloalkane dehalogenase